MSRLIVSILFSMLLAMACGDNFDRDELINGPQGPEAEAEADTDLVTME